MMMWVYDSQWKYPADSWIGEPEDHEGELGEKHN